MAKVRSKNKCTGVEEEIKDLYWFEENGVRDWDGKGMHEDFEFRFEVGFVD